MEKRAYLQEEEGEGTSRHGGSRRLRGSHGVRRRLRRGAASKLVIAREGKRRKERERGGQVDENNGR